MPNKRVLVTGAAGLLGSRVIPLLVAKEYQVIAVVRPGLNRPSNENIFFLEADLTKERDFKSVGKLEAIFHFAQASGHTDFIHSARNIANISIDVTCSLAEYACAIGAKRFVFTSSGGVYGGGAAAFREENPLPGSTALSFYLETKLAAERLLGHFSKHMDVTILRPFFIYGPGQREELLIARLKKSILEKKEIFLAEDRGPLLNPIYVEDAAKAIVACLDSKDLPGLINIAGNGQMSLRRICKILGSYLSIEPVFVRKNECAINFLGDNTLMRKHLRVPTTTMEEGLKTV